MRKVRLKMNEQYKYEIIKDIANGRKTKANGAVSLSCSIRTINRLLVVYKTIGKKGFIHGNRNTVSNNAISLDISNDIVALYDNKYEGFNYKHFQEKLLEDEGITVSESFVRKLLNANGFISPKANRITKRDYLKKQIISNAKDELSQEDIDDIIELNIKDAHPSRERKKYFGELIQLDASDHLWFGDEKMHLHAAIDDATGKIVGLYFDRQETLYGYYMVYSQILHKYGIPYEFLTDKRTVFEYKRKNASSIEKDTFTQFGYACKTFGTHITTSSIPQAKGRVERLFNTLQSRLVSELRVAGITSIDSANEFLIPFVEKFNQKFSLQLNNSMNVFSVVENIKQIDLTLAVLSPRVINNGSCIKYQNKTYYPEKLGERKYFARRTKALVIKSLSGKLYSSIGNELYLLEELQISSSTSIEFDIPSVIIKKRKKYIPPMSHPYKYASFQKYVEKQSHLKKVEIENMFD